MLSNKVKNEIALICYAAVLGNFAMFHNEKMRGSNFKWENFVEICESQSFTWMITNYGGKRTPEVEHCFQQYAKDIATHALERAGYV